MQRNGWNNIFTSSSYVKKWSRICNSNWSKKNSLWLNKWGRRWFFLKATGWECYVWLLYGLLCELLLRISGPWHHQLLWLCLYCLSHWMTMNWDVPLSEWVNDSLMFIKMFHWVNDSLMLIKMFHWVNDSLMFIKMFHWVNDSLMFIKMFHWVNDSLMFIKMFHEWDEWMIHWCLLRCSTEWMIHWCLLRCSTEWMIHWCLLRCST